MGKGFFTAILMTAVLSTTIFFGHHFADRTGLDILKRIMTLLGGDFFGGFGFIQSIIFFATFWALNEISYLRRITKKELSAFRFQLLPDTGQNLSDLDLQQIAEKLGKIDKSYNYLLLDVIKKALSKFKLTRSISETITIVSMQVDIVKERTETNQSNIRYLIWLIPSVGFIGTVIGISQSLLIANTGDMNAITRQLGVAFDTTLIALFLSIVVTWKFSRLQINSEHMLSNIKDYVIEKLINRIEVIS